jgi:hypothetical protein
MLLKAVKRSNYAKWFGETQTHQVRLELRPKLDKWDVCFLDNRYIRTHNWYMYQKSERFNTMLEAIVFILNTFAKDEVQIQDRFSPEVTAYDAKEIQMKEKAVANITLVYGKDSRFVTDEEIYAHIKRLETDIRGLNSIENKPKKLEAKVESIKGDIKDLVAVVDGR